MLFPSAYLKGVKQTWSFYPRSYAKVSYGHSDEAVQKNIESVLNTISTTIHGFESQAAWYRTHQSRQTQPPFRK
jgi:hypothetical protein